jgi:hypothetical protein
VNTSIDTKYDQQTVSISPSWLGIAGVVIMAGALFLAYALKQEGAAELQTAPWQTLLFIDHTTKNL